MHNTLGFFRSQKNTLVTVNFKLGRIQSVRSKLKVTPDFMRSRGADLQTDFSKADTAQCLPEKDIRSVVFPTYTYAMPTSHTSQTAEDVNSRHRECKPNVYKSFELVGMQTFIWHPAYFPAESFAGEEKIADNDRSKAQQSWNIQEIRKHCTASS